MEGSMQSGFNLWEMRLKQTSEMNILNKHWVWGISSQPAGEGGKLGVARQGGQIEEVAREVEPQESTGQMGIGGELDGSSCQIWGRGVGP